MWRGVSAGRGGRHQDEAGAHHILLLLHHGRARSRVGALETVLKVEKDDSQNQRARITLNNICNIKYGYINNIKGRLTNAVLC